MTTPFDPNAASAPDSGLFGLPFDLESAAVAVLPVPFAATTSYLRGAQHGPAAVVEASRQVDLYDHTYGDFWSSGIALCPDDADIARWDAEATALADRVIAVGGQVDGDPALVDALHRVNDLCGRLNDRIHARVAALLAAGKRVATLGGDHAVPFGAIAAHAERYPGLGILHLDAHADLRPAYEGFTWSHASIMGNVLDHLPGVARIVQVGIRDYSAEERQRIADSDGRVVTFFDADLAARLHEGETWRALVDGIVAALPPRVYLSFDIDGLEPALCPHTGTPVPGGLGWREVEALLRGVVRSGRTIVGLDLVEVAPDPAGNPWDANVGARLLYKMIGAMMNSQRDA